MRGEFARTGSEGRRGGGAWERSWPAAPRWAAGPGPSKRPPPREPPRPQLLPRKPHSGGSELAACGGWVSFLADRNNKINFCFMIFSVTKFSPFPNRFHLEPQRCLLRQPPLLFYPPPPLQFSFLCRTMAAPGPRSGWRWSLRRTVQGAARSAAPGRRARPGVRGFGEGAPHLLRSAKGRDGSAPRTRGCPPPSCF